MIELSDVDELLKQASVDRDRARALADAEYDATVEAILRIKKLLKRRAASVPAVASAEAPPLSATPPDVSRSNQRQWRGLRASIRESIAESPPFGFTLDDVMNYLTATYPRAVIKRVAVSGELWRMSRSGEIEILEKGTGNKPHTYVKNSTSNGDYTIPSEDRDLISNNP